MVVFAFEYESMRSNWRAELPQPGFVSKVPRAGAISNPPKKDEDKDEDEARFLVSVFDSKVPAEYLFFEKYGANLGSLRAFLWILRGLDYYRLRKLIVCGLDGFDQQETPARLLYEKGGFLDNIHVYLPKNATVVEALPTADSGTDDPSGFIHAILRQRYPQYKFGFLPTAVAETNATATLLQPIPSETKYKEPMVTVKYEETVKETDTLSNTNFCMKSAQKALTRLLDRIYPDKLGKPSGMIGDLFTLGGDFFKPLTDEERNLKIIEEYELLKLIHNKGIMSGFVRRIYYESFKGCVYYREYFLKGSKEIHKIQRLSEMIEFNDDDLHKLSAHFLGVIQKLDSKRVMKRLLNIQNKLQELDPNITLTMVRLEFSDQIKEEMRNTTNSKAVFLKMKGTLNSTDFRITRPTNDDTHNALCMPLNQLDFFGEQVFWILTTIENHIFSFVGSLNQEFVPTSNFTILNKSEYSSELESVNGFPSFFMMHRDTIWGEITQREDENEFMQDCYFSSEELRDLYEGFIGYTRKKLMIHLRFDGSLYEFQEVVGKQNEDMFYPIKGQLEFTVIDNFTDHFNFIGVEFLPGYYLLVTFYKGIFLCLFCQLDDENQPCTAIIVLNFVRDIKESTRFSDKRAVITLKTRQDDFIAMLDNVPIEYIKTKLSECTWIFDHYELTEPVVIDTGNCDRTMSEIYQSNDLMNSLFKSRVSDSIYNSLKLSFRLVKWDITIFLFVFITLEKKTPHILVKMEQPRYSDKIFPVFKLIESEFAKLDTFKTHSIHEFLTTYIEDIIEKYNSLIPTVNKLRIVTNSLNDEHNFFTAKKEDNENEAMYSLRKEYLKRTFTDTLNELKANFHPKTFEVFNVGVEMFFKSMEKTKIEITHDFDERYKEQYEDEDEEEYVKKPKLDPFLKLLRTTSKGVLSTVRIKNRDEKSFWNHFCGELNDFDLSGDISNFFGFQLHSEPGPFYSLMVSIYITLICYITEKSRIVTREMSISMQEYIYFLFSKVCNFELFLKYVMERVDRLKVSFEDLNSVVVDNNLIKEICTSLNLDIHFYELRTLQRCIDFSMFLVSRKDRIKSKRGFILTQTECGSYTVDFIRGLKVERAGPKITIEKYLIYRDDFYTAIEEGSYKLIGKTESFYKVMEQPFTAWSRGYFQNNIYRLGIDMIDKRKSIMREAQLFYKDVNKWPGGYHELYDKSHSMPTWRAQLYVNMFITTHYNDIVQFYFSKDYKIPKKKEYQYDINRDELWSAFVEMVKFLPEYYQLQPIDLEFISQYTGVNVIVLQSNRLELDNQPYGETKKSKFEIPFRRLKRFQWCTNVNIYWSFGEYREVGLKTHSNSLMVAVNQNGKMACRVGFSDQLNPLSYSSENTFEYPPNLKCFELLRYRTALDQSKERAQPELDISEYEIRINIFQSMQFLNWDEFMKKSFDRSYYDLKKQILVEMGYDNTKSLDHNGLNYEWEELMTGNGDVFDTVLNGLQILPTSLFHMIAKMYNQRIIILSFHDSRKIRRPSEIFSINGDDVKNFNYLKLSDQEKDSKQVAASRCIILIKQDIFMKTEQDQDYDPDFWKDNKFGLWALGILPPDTQIPLNLRPEVMIEEVEENEEEGDDRGENSDDDEGPSPMEEVDTKFHIENHYSDLSPSYTLIGAKPKTKVITKKKSLVLGIMPIPIHILQRDDDVKNALTDPSQERYLKLFTKNHYQPIIVTHRQAAKVIKQYSYKCYMSRLRITTNDIDPYVFIDGEFKINPREFNEMYSWDQVVERYEEEKRRDIPLSIHLDKRISSSDLKTGRIANLIDLMRCVRITMAASNSHFVENNQSNFFKLIEDNVSKETQLLFKIFGSLTNGTVGMREVFNYNKSNKYFSVGCMGIWHPQYVNLTVAMQLINYFIYFLEHDMNQKLKFEKLNRFDERILEMLKTARTRWFNNGAKRDPRGKPMEKQGAANTIDSYLVEMDDGLYSTAVLSDDEKMEDLRVLSILYHLEFRQVVGFGKYGSNCFTERIFTHYMFFKTLEVDRVYQEGNQKQKRGQRGGGKQLIHNKPFFSFFKELDAKGNILTWTNRIFSMTNFPPYSLNYTDAEKLPSQVFNNLKGKTDKKEKRYSEENYTENYKVLRNAPRLNIYLLEDPHMARNGRNFGYLVLKGNLIQVDDPAILRDINDKSDSESDSENEESSESDSESDDEEESESDDEEESEKEEEEEEKKEKKKNIDGGHAGDCPHSKAKKFKFEDDLAAIRGNDKGMRSYGYGSKKGINGNNVFTRSDGTRFAMNRNGKTYNIGPRTYSNFSIGHDFEKENSLASNPKHSNPIVWAEGNNKEIHMLSAGLGVIIAMLERLEDNGFLTCKMNKGLTVQSRLLTTMLLPCFRSVTSYPISNIFTDHILFAGKGFSSQRMIKYRVLERLKGCMDLTEASVIKEYETLRESYENRARWDAFENRVASCSEKMTYDNCFNIFKTAQVVVEGALKSYIKPGSGDQSWLTKELAAALNQLVFRKINASDRDVNKQMMMGIIYSPLGDQLRAIFDPVLIKISPVIRSIGDPSREDYESD